MEQDLFTFYVIPLVYDFNILKDCHLGHLKLKNYGPIKFYHHDHGHIF